MAAGKDYREELTAKLIEQLETGTAPWQKPWESRSRLPFNATTEKPYRGVNSLYLSAVGATRDYEDPRWATYRQAAERNWQVRKGEKGVGIEYWKHTDSQPVRDAEGKPVRDENGKPLMRETALARPRVFYATVFNLQQMDGAPALATTHRSYAWDHLERAERIVQSSGATVIHDQADRAYYTPGLDQIHMPKRDQFKDAAAYYGTALHELGHYASNRIMPRQPPARRPETNSGRGISA